jgi:hypothetical protein
MTVLDLILLTLGAVCFLLATIKYASARVEFVAFGLLFWILVPWIHAVDAVL